MNGEWEFYDIDVDRTELHDLAARHPDRVGEMSAAWQQWARVSHVLPLRPWDDAPAAAGPRAE